MSRHVISARSSERSSSSLQIPLPPSTFSRQKQYRTVEIRRELKTDRERLNATLPFQSNKGNWRDARTARDATLHSVTWQDLRSDGDTSFRSVLRDTKSERDVSVRPVAGYDISLDKDYSVRSVKTLKNYRSSQTSDDEYSSDKESTQTPLDTNRAIPIVQWQKISSIPETDRADESIGITNPVDLKKCLTCKEDRKILKLLPCLHSFCRQCLERQIQENPSRSWFRCDLCKNQTHIPSKGIEGFEDNRYFDFSEYLVTENDRCDKCKGKIPSCRCSDCGQNLCSECVHGHLNEDTSKSHYVINVTHEMLGKSSLSAVCEEHSPFTLELFCLTCSEAICGRCAIQKHNHHIAENIQATASDKRKELKALLTDSTTKRAIRDAHEYTKTCLKEKANIQADVQTTVNSIEVHIQALKDELDKLGKDMIKDVVEKEVSLMATMEKNIEDAEAREKASFASIETLKQMIDRTRDLELINKSNNLKAVISEVKKSCKPPPAKCVKIKYKPLVHSVRSSVGRVNMEAILKRPVHYVELGSLQLGKSISCIHPVDDLKAWVAFRKYIQLCSKDGAFGPRVDIGELVYGMAANSNGTVFTACKTSVKVVTNKMNAKFLFQLLHEPSDLKINERDFFIISFREAKRVALFDTKGKAVHEFDIRHFGFRFGVRINDPWKLAISETQDIYLTDFGSEGIGVFDSQCEIKYAFESNVYRHAALCCDRGLIFISDYKRDCVQVYSQEGQLLQTCQMQGIIAPCSIAVDKQGDLWIGSWNGLVKIYSPR